MTHNYSGYTHGCRCDVCRRAKADYMRERRARHRGVSQKHTVSSTGRRGAPGTARAPGATRYVAPIDRHGTRAGYDEHSCRCFPCTDARMAAERRWRGGAA